MLTHSPQNCGSSVHNQRIERLWRDTYRCVISLYYQVFYYLEDKELLDPDSECDLFCLHLVYKDKINYTLKSFVDGWNNHGITTERNLSPIQLFTCGLLFSNQQDNCCLPSVDTHLESFGHLGVEQITIPSTFNPLSAIQLSELQTVIRYQQHDCDDYGINTYTTVRTWMRNQIV